MRLIIFLFIFLFGCSPSFKASKHLRKAKKHILKAESYGAKWSKDTVYQEVAVEVPKVTVDTIFRSDVGDTVVITKDRLEVKYIRLRGDSVFIEGTCKADTVYKSVPVVVNNEIKCPPDKWRLPALVFAGIIVLMIILAFIRL